MANRRLSFDERRQHLADALNVLVNALDDYGARAQIYSLRIVASQLRALIYDNPHSRNSHPLLIELAQERNFPLTVYRTNPAYAAKVKQIGPVPPIFYSGVDDVAADGDELRSSETTLDVAMKAVHTTVMGQEYTLEQIILFVANKEAAHYDPDRPVVLDDFDCILLGDLPVHYRVIYHMGRVVRDLTSRFLQSTA